MFSRPYGSTGAGWILALLVLVVAVLSLFVQMSIDPMKLIIFLIIGLALAILI